MKLLDCKIVFLVLLFGFVSCKSSYIMTIETLKPAAILVPRSEGVVIVNNTVSQPMDFGRVYYLKDKVIEPSVQANTDSISLSFQQVFANHIQEKNFFPAVATYNEGVRTDNEWLSLHPIPKEVRDSIYEDANMGAIISIDRLIIMMTHKVNPRYTSDTDPLVDIKLEAKLNCSVYLEGREKALTSFSIEDSLRFIDLVPNDTTILYVYLPAATISDLGSVLCEKLTEYFVPTWTTSNRLFFTNLSSRMQEALAYAKGKKWKDASQLWESIYESETKTLDKAKLAINIAEAYEMLDQLDIALNWTNQAGELFQQTKENEYETEKDYYTAYKEELEKRILNNTILDVQYRNE